MSSPVAFVLVGTRSPGNLGAVCRVAKTFGFPDVRLVAPRFTAAEREAIALAHGAEDVLAAAPVFETLPEALVGCFRSVATTARPRDSNRPVLTPSAWADDPPADGPYALVFGPEDRGLSNEDLAACDEVLSIPLPEGTGATLSLPAAASILAYELSRALGRLGAPAGRSERSRRGARELSAEELDSLLGTVEATLSEIGFRPRPSADRFRGSLRDFLSRARPTVGDRLLLRHVFAQVGKWRRRWTGRAPHPSNEEGAANP
jgi:TrmH family RNA methyltransferase